MPACVATTWAHVDCVIGVTDKVEIVFDHHLPRHRRLLWQALEGVRRRRLAGQGHSADVVAALDGAARARR